MLSWTPLCLGQTSAAREDKADKAAFDEVCSKCHPSNMVTDFRSEPEWKETVEHMVAIGATGTEEQFSRIMRYLLRNLTKVNVNTATAVQIAPVLDLNQAAAQALVDYRTEHGLFKTFEELKKVPKLNASKLESRKDRIVF
jgi:competence protein ComEA